MLITILPLFCSFYVVESVHPFARHKSLHYYGQSAGEPLILTPLINSGNISVARSKARNHLADSLGIKSYSGYFTVNATHSSNLFFWFFPSEHNYRDDPVVLWLQGGPGSSSLIGLFLENGPLEVTRFQTLKKRKFTWQSDHSMVFIDSPVGTGFSFTNSEDGYAMDQVKVGEDLYNAILQFFTLFPEIRKNPFFITGESYGGKYVPALSYTIHSKNPNSKLKINFNGFAIGNGLTDPIYQFKYGKYLYEIGLIDNTTEAKMKEVESVRVDNIKNEDWGNAAVNWNQDMDMFLDASGFSNYYNYLYPVDNTDFDTFSNFLNEPTVRTAIHVGNRTYHVDGDKVYDYLVEDIPKTVAPWVSELLGRYRGLFYVGQLDVICNYPGVVNFLQHLNFSAAEEYKSVKRKIWRYRNDVAGYIKTAGNMSEALVRNSGHLVPRDQPEWALDLITKFTRNKL